MKLNIILVKCYCCVKKQYIANSRLFLQLKASVFTKANTKGINILIYIQFHFTYFTNVCFSKYLKGLVRLTSHRVIWQVRLFVVRGVSFVARPHCCSKKGPAGNVALLLNTVSNVALLSGAKIISASRQSYTSPTQSASSR